MAIIYLVVDYVMAFKMKILEIKNLKVEVDGNIVVDGLDMSINSGEIVLLFGPNASGKTSLAMAILGHPKYKIVDGKILFYGRDITHLSMESKVRLGLTVTFQFSPELKGVTLRELANALVRRNAVPEKRVSELIRLLKVDYLLDRHVNVGFSGGERKRAEIFLTALQSPKFVIFDEPDSGVDPDSIPLIGRAMMKMMEYGLKGALIITHTGFLVKHINASRAYVMINRKIICSGPADILSAHILSHGFDMCVMRQSDKCVMEGEI